MSDKPTGMPDPTTLVERYATAQERIGLETELTYDPAWEKGKRAAIKAAYNTATFQIPLSGDDLATLVLVGQETRRALVGGLVGKIEANIYTTLAQISIEFGIDIRPARQDVPIPLTVVEAKLPEEKKEG